MPAILFNLWNPFWVDDRTLIFEVTQADSFQVGVGSQEFIGTSLRMLGVTSDASTWKITPGCSFYYSSYPKDDNWEDRWPYTWRVHVSLETPSPPRPNELFQGPVPQGLNDDTSSGLDDERFLHTAFVIVDFLKSRGEVEQLAQNEIARSRLPVIQLDPAIRDVGGGISQLQLVAQNIDLPSDVAPLEEMLAGFKAAGGAVNWRSRLSWVARSSGR